MLVLTRKRQERIQIGDGISITVLRIKGKTVRLGIEAPDHYDILRGELAITTSPRFLKQETDRVHQSV
ncbi:MAG: carbon storage regulator [Pirellulales bacterium]|nr:carbon storage regulator [Pirellulales bacterium]